MADYSSSLILIQFSVAYNFVCSGNVITKICKGPNGRALRKSRFTGQIRGGSRTCHRKGRQPNIFYAFSERTYEIKEILVGEEVPHRSTTANDEKHITGRFGQREICNLFSTSVSFPFQQIYHKLELVNQSFSMKTEDFKNLSNPTMQKLR